LGRINLLASTHTFSSLSEPGFRWYWVSTLATYAASQMDGMLRGWIVYNMTGSAASLGLVSLAAGVPLVIISFFGGVVADRVDRLKFLLVTQAMAALIALTTGVLIATRLIEFWHFILLAMMQGITFAFIAPLRQSIIARLVQPSNLMSAIALSSTSFNIMGIAGPAAVGLLLTFMLPQYVYYLIVGFFVAGIALLSLINLPREEAKAAGAFHLDLAEGFRFIGSNRRILALLMIALIPAFFCIPYIYMMPALAIKTLRVDQAGLGFLLASAGVGALIGSLTAGSLTGLKNKGTLVLVLLFTFGCGIALVAQFQSLALAMLLIFSASISSTTYMTLSNTMIIMGTPPALHGRVISIFTMTAALTPIGALPLGAAADYFGIPATFLVAGSIAMLFALIMWLFVPALKKVQ
jgi:MFS family permease